MTDQPPKNIIPHEVYMELLKMAQETGYGVRYLVGDYVTGIQQMEEEHQLFVSSPTSYKVDARDTEAKLETVTAEVMSNTKRIAHDFDHWRELLNKWREQWFDDGIGIKANKAKVQDLLAFMISHREIIEDQASAISDHTQVIGGLVDRVGDLDKRVHEVEDDPMFGGVSISQRVADALRVFRDTQQEVKDHTELFVEALSRISSLETSRTRFVNDIALLSDGQAATAKRVGVQQQHTEVTIKQLSKHETDIIVLNDTVKALRQAGKELKGIVDTAIEYGQKARGLIWTKVHELAGWRDEALPQIRSLQVQDEVQARHSTRLDAAEASHAERLHDVEERLRDLENKTFGAIAPQDIRVAKEAVKATFVDELSTRAREVYRALLSLRAQGMASTTSSVIGPVANVTGGNLTRAMRELRQAEVVRYTNDSRGHIDYSSVECL